MFVCFKTKYYACRRNGIYVNNEVNDEGVTPICLLWPHCITLIINEAMTKAGN